MVSFAWAVSFTVAASALEFAAAAPVPAGSFPSKGQPDSVTGFWLGLDPGSSATLLSSVEGDITERFGTIGATTVANMLLGRALSFQCTDYDNVIGLYNVTTFRER